MLNRLVRRPSAAMVVAFVAVCVALSGTSYGAEVRDAATGLITGAQIKDGSIALKELTTNARKSLKGNRGLRGFRGATGAAGATGATGLAGAKGDAGANFTLATTLPSGQTLRGGYSLWGGGAGTYLGTAVDYRIPLAQPIPAGNAHFVSGVAFTLQCPGFGQALAGHMCLYEEVHSNTTFGVIFSHVNNTQVQTGTSAGGFHVYFNATGATAYSYGEWAVTAP